GFFPLNGLRSYDRTLDLHVTHGGGPSHVSRRQCAQIPSFNLTMVDAGNAPKAGQSPNGENIDRLLRASNVQTMGLKTK
ncbi:hypothetical protein, partial [Virgibacillus salarius]|uniref:hypothetical protein n=1 Tax=Virgibacillus salarius TaxID=447199 RepID=UPI0031E29B7C